MKPIQAVSPEFFAVVTTDSMGSISFLRTHKSTYRGSKRIWINEDAMPRHSGCTNDEGKALKMLDAALQGNQQLIEEAEEAAEQARKRGDRDDYFLRNADAYRARTIRAVRIRIEDI